MDCNKITSGVTAPLCNSLPQGGTINRAWIFNWEDVNHDTDDSDIGSLSLDSGSGFIVHSMKNAIEGSASLNVGTYVTTYDHQVSMRIFNDDSDTIEFIQSLAGARVVIALAVKSTFGTERIEVYGYQSGMILSENNYSTKYTDGAVYMPVFKTDADSKEAFAPQSASSMTPASVDALCQGRTHLPNTGGSTGLDTPLDELPEKDTELDN